MDKTEYQFYLDALCACYRDVASAFPAQHQWEHRRDVDTILHRARCEGIEFLTKTLPSLAKAIDYALATGTVLQVPNFGRRKGSKLPRFCGWLIGQVFHTDGTERHDACPVALKYLRTLLSLFYKLELPHNKTQENEVYTTFKCVDHGLQNPWSLTEPKHKYAVKYAARLVGRVLAGKCPRDISPKHGPGSTSDGAKPNEKPNFLGFYRAIQQYYPFDGYYCWGPEHISARLTTSGLGLADGGPLRDLGTSTAKVVLVPKDSRGPRLISMEPTETQWIQQGQLQAMVDTIANSWLTRDHVNFRNQGVNRALAYIASEHPVRQQPLGGSVQEPLRGRSRHHLRLDQGINSPVPSRDVGSVSGNSASRPGPSGGASRHDAFVHLVCGSDVGSERRNCPNLRAIAERTWQEVSRNGTDLVTLDMKDASDRVSLQLVQTLFPSNWVEALEATRSPQTMLPTGEIVTLNKFAPMGSAVCFPVEALCFWALAVASIHTERPHLPLKRLRELVWVYGDDIICYRKDYPIVIAALERVGLKFNVNKCCTAGSFRESCGLDAYKGVIVTPTRFKSRWSHRLGVQELASYIAYSNALYDAGFHELATFLEGKIQQQIPIPYTCVKGSMFQFVRPSADVLALNRARGIPMRFNRRIHTLEALGFSCRTVTTPGPADTYEALLYRMAQSGRLGSASSDDQEPNLEDAGGKPPSSEPLPVGLYPIARRVTRHRAWTRVIHNA